MADITRRVALDAALALHTGHPPDLDAIRRTADVLVAWLNGTTRIRLIPGPVSAEAATVPPGTTTGGKMQLNTGQKVTYTIDTEDASGYDTNETIEWTVDAEDVVTLNVSEDSRSATVVSGAPGSAVLTAKIPGMDLSATEAIDVVPAGTATIKLIAGEVSEENAGGDNGGGTGGDNGGTGGEETPVEGR